MDRERARALERVPHGSSDDPDVVDFSANTNPRTPEGTEAVYREAFADASRYPAEPPEAYRAAAAAYVDRDRADGADSITPEQVVPTPGGLAAMRLAIALAVDPGDTVLVPAPSFGEYAREVRLQGGDPVFVDAESVPDSDPESHAMAVVCNPNNPTGRAYEHDALQEYAQRCREAGACLLVDEAFLGFTDRPSMAGEEGVIVARSLTKLFGLPGIRAGFAVATGDLLAELRGGRRAWNMGSPALAVGTHCMGQHEFVETTRERVRSERERIVAALGPHYDIVDSDAPFLLLDVGERSVESVLESATAAGIELRDARTFRGLDSHVRAAVRGADDNDWLVEVLRDV
jgi:histidinol-phosphate/aromatic aminotransferase/cobyric acid decarboxylase-like protein